MVFDFLFFSKIQANQIRLISIDYFADFVSDSNVDAATLSKALRLGIRRPLRFSALVSPNFAPFCPTEPDL